MMPRMKEAMTTANQVPYSELLKSLLDADPELAEEWERLVLARHVAAELIRYRSKNGLSQRALAERLDVSQPRVVELESGEKNPQFETLAHIVAVTGIELAISLVPMGADPKLVGQAVKGSGAHTYAGASVLVASR
jgi:DNA-binding XRE family transcriptional regulator